MSIYRTPENVAPEATLDQIQRGLVVKYEKHSMCATLRYLSHTELDPFDEIYAFIKVATDGRPGTEKTKLIFDLKDNSFDGLNSFLGEYTPAGETEHLDSVGAYQRERTLVSTSSNASSIAGSSHSSSSTSLPTCSTYSCAWSMRATRMMHKQACLSMHPGTT